MARNLKVIASYIAFVGLPLLALIGVLRMGRDLTAPVSVAGLWKATINSDQSASCRKEMAPLQENSISIIQSGRGLVLALERGKGVFSSGAIAGDALSGTLSIPAALAQDTHSDRAFVIEAHVNPHARPRTLDGIISPAQGGSCGPARFHATRQSTLN
jgi:hypothetical protein